MNKIEPTIQLADFSFSFNESQKLLEKVNFSLYPEECALLVGANGTGKSTLLRILYGLHLTRDPGIRVLGKSPFDSLELVREIGIVQGELGVNLDLRVEELLKGSLSSYQKELLELLGINLQWRMHQVSDGERKRVQLYLGLQNENIKLLLLDEVTAHLDVTVRNDLMSWLKKRARMTGLSVLYCTHIFDGLVEGQGQNLKVWFDRGLWLGFKGRSNSFAYQSVARLLQGSSMNQVVDAWIRGNQGE